MPVWKNRLFAGFLCTLLVSNVLTQQMQQRQEFPAFRSQYQPQFRSQSGPMASGPYPTNNYIQPFSSSQMDPRNQVVNQQPYQRQILQNQLLNMLTSIRGGSAGGGNNNLLGLLTGNSNRNPMSNVMPNNNMNQRSAQAGPMGTNFPTLQLSPGLAPDIVITPVIPQPEPLQMSPMMKLPQQRTNLPNSVSRFYPATDGINGAEDPYYAQGWNGGMGGAVNDNPYGTYSPNGGSTYGNNNGVNAYQNTVNTGGNDYSSKPYSSSGSVAGGSSTYGAGSSTYAAGSDSGAGQTQPQECVCTTEYLPICGSDGVTYTNLCVLRCDNLNKPYVKAVSKGECSSSDTGGYGTVGNVPCSWQCTTRTQNVCDSTGTRYLNSCVFWKSVCRATTSGTTTVPTLAPCPDSGSSTSTTNRLGIIIRGATTPMTLLDTIPAASTTTEASHFVTPMTSDIKNSDSGIVLRSLDTFDPFHSQVALAREAASSDPMGGHDLSER